MLIDPFPLGWTEELVARTINREVDNHFFLLIDGAFVPGLHRAVAEKHKAILFEDLPGCTDETREVSPFLMPFASTVDAATTGLLRRCDTWPMLSLIETPETLNELAARLAAWCIVETDDLVFNFRFPDTRRLPAIYQVLTGEQRGQLAGPAKRWSFNGRDGAWCELALDAPGGAIADRPKLSADQFARLVDDSRADELMVMLRDRGRDTFGKPSRCHAMIALALRAAADAKLDEQDSIEWCDWFLENGQLVDRRATAPILAGWQRSLE